MKKLFSRPVKGIAALLVSLLALNLTCVPALAQDTEIYTVVPEQYTITVSLEEGGAVIDADGVVHTESYTAEVSHGGALSLFLRPDSGYALASARLDGQEVAVSGGRMVLEHIRQDGELVVSWKQAPAPPNQKTYTVVGTVTENGQPAAGVTLELRSRLQTFVTGADGKFRFDKVEYGEHSLTALRDGKAVGYLSFTLEENGDGVNIKKLPDGTFLLTVDGNVATLELAITMNGDGTMDIVKATSITEEKAQQNYPPATGDDSMLVCWFAAMLAAGALVILLMAYRKRKKIQE